MTRQEMIEAAARADGFDYFTNGNGVLMGYRTPEGEGEYVPAYASDYNAVHRLIAGLDGYEKEIFIESLRLIVDADWTILSDMDQFNMVNATCVQMLEAYLKAKGAWKE